MTDPVSLARAREAAGLHRLRKGREQCGAHRRDGQPCQAPAIEGGTVCLKHGGSAPQVQIVAKHFLLLEAFHDATVEYEEARGTPGEFDALCSWSQAQLAVDEYEAKMERLAELRSAVKRRKAGSA